MLPEETNRNNFCGVNKLHFTLEKRKANEKEKLLRIIRKRCVLCKVCPFLSHLIMITKM